MTLQDQGDGDKLIPLLPSHLENGGTPATLTMNFYFCSLSLDHFCDPCFLVLPGHSAPFLPPSLSFLLTQSKQGMLGLLSGYHRRVGKLRRTSLGVLSCPL